MSHGGRSLELIEYQPKELSRDELTDIEAESLHRLHKERVSVEAPSFKNDNWVLQCQGWVGYLPVTEDLYLSIAPKVPIHNLFRMLEYAYRLQELFFPDVTEAGSLAEFYERLASVFARRVLDRARKGLYATYVPHHETLSFVRGSIDIRERLRRPWDVRIICDYQEHTADVEENQILAWTLSRIAHSGLCSDRVLPIVRRAYHTVQALASLKPFGPQSCLGRLYNRLNDDYHPLHALCRFFLESSGPTMAGGDHRRIPFAVEMSRLFELFVAEWLRKNLPASIDVRAQENVDVGDDERFRLEMDMVLYERETNRPLCVLDAKYKAPDKPDNADLYQVVAYAEAIGCSDAILVYPTPLTERVDVAWGQKRVRSAVFALGQDLEIAGQAMLAQLQPI